MIFRRYAALVECTSRWLDMTLTPAAMGFTTVVEGAIKTAMKSHPKAARDIMFSYLLGKFDSKLLAQAAIVCLRRNALLRCINPAAAFSREITIYDMQIAYSRMKVRNWYVRGVTNEIHSPKELAMVRDQTTPEEEAHAKTMLELFATCDATGIVDYDKALRAMKAKEALKNFANHKELVQIVRLMVKANLVAEVGNKEHAQEQH